MITRKELNDSVIYGFESIFSGICSLLFYVLVANLLDVKDVGAYALVIVYASVLASLANFGLISGYERTYFEYAVDVRQKGKLIYSLQFFSATSIFIFVIITIAISDVLADSLLGDAKYSRLWILILCGIAISEFNKFYLTYLRNSRQAKLFSLIHIAQVLINLCAGYFLLTQYHAGVESIGVSLLLSHLVVFVWMFIHQLKSLPLYIDRKIFQAVARLSLPLTPRIVAGFIGTQFDKILLSQFANLDSLGVYSVAQRLAMSVYMLMNAVGRVWQPRLYEELFAHGTATNTRFLLEYMAISFFPALILICFSWEVFLFFPEEYSGGAEVLTILCLYYVILYFSKITGQQLLFAKQTWLISGLSFFAIIINALVTYPLVVFFDAFGAALGTLISSVVIGVASFCLAQRHAYLRWNFSAVSFCCGYLALSALLILIFEGEFFQLEVLNLVFKLAAFLGFVALCYGLKIVDVKGMIKLLRSDGA